MERDNSYRYVFFELLKFTENITIVYQHKAFATTKEDGDLDGGSQWRLSLVSIGGNEKLENFGEFLAKMIDQKVNYIKENKLDLYSFFDFFIERLEENKLRLEKLQLGNLKIHELIKEGIIEPNYYGYLPLRDHDNLYILGIMGAPAKTEHDQNSFDELHRILSYYLDIIILELTRIVLFLKHELNLAIIQKQQLKNQKGKDEFLNLIKEGRIQQLFMELDSTEEYRYDEEVILLSARYYSIENDKNQNVINRDEYNIQSAKLISSLIKAILKNQKRSNMD